MRSSQEVMVHGSLIKLGYNVPAPAPLIAEKDQELMPDEEVRDKYYEIAPDIAGLSLSKRRQLLKALVLTLLTPIQIVKFDDYIEEWIVDFTIWMRKNPGFESKMTRQEKAEAYSKFLADCGKREFESQEMTKRMAKKVLGEMTDCGSGLDGLDLDKLKDMLNDDDD